MRCPWCDFPAGPRGDPGADPRGLTPRALHAHLGERHGDQVRTGERNGKVFYEIICPACGERYEHLMRKAGRDPAFVEGFGREIRMVALDMLVHHLMAEHEMPGDGQPQDTLAGQSGTGDERRGPGQ